MALTDFPEMLKRHLKEKGLSQSEFAKMMNVSRSTVSYWLSGKRDPDSEIVFKICEVLDVSYWDLSHTPENSSRQDLRLLFYRAGLSLNDFEPQDLVKIRQKVIEGLLIWTRPYNKKLTGKEE